MKKLSKKIFVASMIGNALEFYDFTIYGFFVAIISPVFFPATDSLTSLISGFGVFAIGFLTRPLGAIFFGHIGDKFGRRKALSFTIIWMAIPTVIIGLLPTYQQIGIAAPILLTLCRVVQGFSAGGEYNGAGVFVIEHSPENKRGFLGGLLTSSGSMGALLASGVGAFFMLPFMPSWAWRVPFFLGGLIAIVGLYMRQQIDESPEFKQAYLQKKPDTLPIFSVLKGNKISFLCTIGIGAMATVPFYIILAYMNPMLLTKGKVVASSMMLISALMSIICVISLPLMGYLSDKIGQSKLMIYAASLMIIFAYPFLWVFENGSLASIILFQAFIMILTEAYTGPSNAFMYKLFDTSQRYTGVALGYTLGLAIFGGTTPYISANLIKYLGSPYTPAFYLIGVGILGLISAIYGEKKAYKMPEIGKVLLSSQN
jgi:MHS family proline/betaine transporter-like MFS transporter